MERDQDSTKNAEMSDLPDSLLIDIMSMASISTRHAIQTCVFSKKWKNLWISLPNLDFNWKEFDKGDPFRDHNRFGKFVERVLASRRNINLFKFELNLYTKHKHPSIMHYSRNNYSSCNFVERAHAAHDNIDLDPELGGNCYYYLSIRRSIEYAIKHHVQVLQIGAYTCKVLPQCLFTCDSLVKLVLFSNSFYNLKNYFCTKTINLPRLQILQLVRPAEGPLPTSGDIFEKFLLGCPELQELWLEKLLVEYESYTIIPLKKLKMLTERNWVQNYRYYTFDTPSLVSYCFVGTIWSFGLAMRCRSQPSLTHARVSISDRLCKVRDYISPFLEDISFHVEHLELCLNINQSPSWYTTMFKLKNLSLCMHNSEFISDIWDHLPNLEKLTLWHCCQFDNAYAQECRERWEGKVKQMALDKCKKLRELEIKYES